MSNPHVLVLGGTGEARHLAGQLVAEGGLRVTLSLAGRTANPHPQPGDLRVGGFGGPQGLGRYIRDNAVDIIVDATHPFAARISQNAEIAAREAMVPLVVVERPAWKPVGGDRWIEAENTTEAAELIGERQRTVFLAIGRQELAPFAARPQHFYVVRSVEPVSPADAPPTARFILDRGPFTEAAEQALFLEHGIEIVVAKNSGGHATYGKIAAARALRLPVVMVRRPRPPAKDSVVTVEEAVAKIRHLAALPAERGE